ncbi:hypothetical protein B0T17DRAFT_485279 [Bombardia bombarda]|uniref:FAD dependent oxidoreductase domain-containing protein n=1 Tax=Bombardia bombarda TaxID=252184 RepID=A0AA39XM81_9PEZI|nr:hypothetical protein B0T17DRAFT_485279 [Bombardia bombarda]
MAASQVTGAYPLKQIQTVAVIGAGISGISTAAHLLRAGLSVTVFERSSASGGIWNYDARPPLDTPFPSGLASEGDYKLSLPEQYGQHHTSSSSSSDLLRDKNAFDKAEISHAPPSACYPGLTTNIPIPQMGTSLASYPAELPAFVGWSTVSDYIRGISKDTGVDAVTVHRTRVEEVRKDANTDKWRVRTLTLEEDATDSGSAPRWTERDDWVFDAVVVASGNFVTPRVPDSPGLKEWKARFPDSLKHSKQYRTPNVYKDANVLVVGASISGMDVVRELAGAAKKVYQSSRGGQYDLAESLIPKGAERVAGIKSFGPLSKSPEGKLSGSMELSDGRVINDINHVLFATGYVTSYPFLSHLHSDTASIEEAGDELLVTADGDMTHNTHKEIFYIPDPTLAIVGRPFHLSAFPSFDKQAQVVARVFSGQASLPSSEAMRAEYRKKVREKGLGRFFHCYLHDAGEVQYVADLVAWVNRDARERGKPEMQGHSEEWIAGYWKLREDAKALFANDSAWEGAYFGRGNGEGATAV